MEYRELGRTGWKISAISFGAWAIGSAWGTVDDKDSLAALHRCLDLGVNFFDTADVYGDGRSERLLARLRKERREPFYIATKSGRRLERQEAGAYNRENLTAFLERSLRNLATETIDLLQLHCPPQQVYYMPEVFDILDDFVKAGKIRFYGVSVEKVEDALKAIEFPGVQSVQLVFNIFRQRPGELFFGQARRRRVGILARLPLSSGMLTGKLTRASVFEPEDHRNFNRHGEVFDVGETFSGVDYEKGLAAVEALRPLAPPGATLGQMALRWILMFPEVTCAIPGAKRASQAEENIAAASLPPLSDKTMAAIAAIYNRQVRAQVHQRW
ncbi:MAG: aldo/keto reductase [Verrucomicrobiota bacterium]|jgi:aryl-alcohol dehydrogenase-like predicted oxidoreductase